MLRQMTLAPRFLVNFWAGLQVARFGHRIKSLGRGIGAQQAAFARLMGAAAGTEFGRTHGLGAGISYEQFRDQVPPQTYGHFQSYIARMIAGEADVLVPGRCPFFVETAGTSGLLTKFLPVPEAMITHFRQGVRDAVFHYAHRTGHAGIFLGRQVHFGASTAVIESKGSYRTSLDGMLTLCLSPWVEANLRSPPAPIAQLPEGAEKTIATARVMLRRDVTLVAGTPALLCDLALAVREAAGPPPPPHLQALWPNLECCLHTGAPLGLYGEQLRALLGPTVRFHEVYASAEGIFAAQDGGSPVALRLLADAGVFFEFLPLSLYHETTLTHAGALCLPLEKIQAGTDYVLVVTTPAGLCRYVTGDIVRFVSVDPPRLQFAGRAAFQLNSFGERVSERDVFESVQAVCAQNGWHATAFHVAPYVQRIAAGQVANVHEWWLELGTHTVKTPMANVLGPELDAQLFHRNADYAARREQGQLGAPQVRLVMPGVFARWAEEQRKTASASKLPRCRPDRLIADQLAVLARFHQDALAPTRPTNPPFPTTPPF
jgi:hypothetical protein